MLVNGKYRKVLILIILLLGFTLSLQLSYSFWQIESKDTNLGVVEDECINIIYSDDLDFNLIKPQAIKDDDGPRTTPKSIAITNNCSTSKTVEVGLNVLKTSSLDSDKIKVYINGDVTHPADYVSNYQLLMNNDPDILEKRLLYKFDIEPNTIIRLNIRMWLDEYATITDDKNSFYTNYYVTIPTDEAEAAYEVVSDMVFNALLLQSEIDREKPVVLQEINRKYDDPSYKMWQDLQATLFEGTPYSRQVIGSSKTVSEFTREEIVDYYNRFYHPENMTLVVVGDIEQEKAIELAGKYFNQTRSVPVGSRYRGENPVTFKSPVNKSFTADVNVDYAVFAYPTGKQDINTVYAEEVFGEILSGGEYSLLNEVIKNQNKTAIYVTDIGLFNHYNGLFGAMAVVPKGNGEKFKNEAVAIINDIAQGKLDEKRLEKAKNRLKSKNIFDEENVSSLAQNIGYAYVLDFKDYHLNYEKGIDAVTLSDVAMAAKRMTAGPMYFGITSNN